MVGHKPSQREAQDPTGENVRGRGGAGREGGREGRKIEDFLTMGVGL